MPTTVAAEVFTNGDARNVGTYNNVYPNDNTSGVQ